MNALLANVPSTSFGLAPDPALPQRDLLLDDEQMAGRLSLLIGRRGSALVDSCEKLRVKYRIGESLRILYRVSRSSRTHLIAAKAVAGPGAAAAHSASGIFDVDLRAAFWECSDDRKIEHLSLLRDKPETLSRVLGDTWHHSEDIAYLPEKCATVRCVNRNDEAIAYAKMYAATEAKSIYTTYLRLASAVTRIVEPLEYSEAHRLLLLNPVTGLRIADLKQEQMTDGFAGLAKTLASLHAAPIPSHLPHFHRHDLEGLHKCARIVGMARPDVATVAKELDCDLRSTVPSREDLVCLHGDVHPKNGIALNGLVTLIDLDQGAVGPAAADLGSLLALLHYNWRIGLLTRRRKQQLASAFLDAYACSRQLPTQRCLRWHTAAALLSERALRSVNRIRPEGLHHLSQLLDDAKEILRTGGVNA